jgi:hypothetical protein
MVKVNGESQQPFVALPDLNSRMMNGESSCSEFTIYHLPFTIYEL